MKSNKKTKKLKSAPPKKSPPKDQILVSAPPAPPTPLTLPTLPPPQFTPRSLGEVGPPLADTPIPEEPPVKSEKNLSFLFLAGIIFFAVIIVSIAATAYIFINLKPRSEMTITPSQPAKTVVQTQPELDKSLWTFEILNGSGKAGTAAKAAAKLQARGYTVVIIGNADKNNYSTTQVFIDNSLTAKAGLMLADIKEDFPTASLSGNLTNSTASARLIVGKN